MPSGPGRAAIDDGSALPSPGFSDSVSGSPGLLDTMPASPAVKVFDPASFFTSMLPSSTSKTSAGSPACLSFASSSVFRQAGSSFSFPSHSNMPKRAPRMPMVAVTVLAR